MYEYVTKVEIKSYRNICSNVLIQLRDDLYAHSINSQPILIGSGANNMVMRNGKGSFDLDYNLVILNMPDLYLKDLRKLKNTIIVSLNKFVDRAFFSDGHDSTSAITVNCCSNDPFHFDIAILYRNKRGSLCRLIHHKNQTNAFSWEEIRSSEGIKQKAAQIKQCGKWYQVRDEYKKRKNLYLSRREFNHPSCVVYIETVNQVYQQIFSKKGGFPMGKGHGASGHTHSQSQLNHYANQNNPNNSAYQSNQDNHANQCNPNNDAYWQSRDNGDK